MGGVLDEDKEEFEAMKDIFILNVNQSSIVSGVPMKERRASATSVKVGSTIFVFGGVNSQGLLNSCEKLDTSQSPMKWEMIAPMEFARCYAGAAVVGGNILVVGGISGVPGTDEQKELDEVEVYNPSSNTWQRGPSLQRPRYAMGVAALDDGTVYVAGGDTDGDPLRSVERLLPGSTKYSTFYANDNYKNLF